MSSGTPTRPLGHIHNFSSVEAQQLLSNKFVVIMGDSNYRSVYKDLIQFLQKEETLTLPQLQDKGTESFANDCRVEWDGLHNGNNFKEARQYRTQHHLVHFYFLTRVFSDYVEKVLNGFKEDPIPDVLIMNSCLWDLNRNHDPNSEKPIRKALLEYQQNLEKLFERLNEVLPPSCLVIWNTAMPIRDARGSVFLSQSNQSTPEDLIEANFYSARLASRHEFDVLDLHYCVRFLENHHAPDGVHWSSWVHRCITKLLLTHIAGAWGVTLEMRRLQPGPERNMDSLNDPRLKFFTSTPRQCFLRGKGYFPLPFNPSIRGCFNPDITNYNDGFMDGYNQGGPGHTAQYANTSRLGHQLGPQGHLGWPSPGNNPNFPPNGSYSYGFPAGLPGPPAHPIWSNHGDDSGIDQNGSYDPRFAEEPPFEQGPQGQPNWTNSDNDSSCGRNNSYGYAFVGDGLYPQGSQHHPIRPSRGNDGYNHNDSYDPRFAEDQPYELNAQPGRGWSSLGNDSGFSLNGSYGERFTNPYQEGPPLQQPGPSRDLGFQGDISFQKEDPVVYECERLSQLEPPLQLGKYVQPNGWYPGAYGDLQRAPPNMAEMHPNDFFLPPPPGLMVRAPLSSPYRFPRGARGRRKNAFLNGQQSQRKVPYKKCQNGSGKGRGTAKPHRRPPYH